MWRKALTVCLRKSLTVSLPIVDISLRISVYTLQNMVVGALCSELYLQDITGVRVLYLG